MHRRQLLALPVLLAAASVLPFLFAQSNSLNLGAELTASRDVCVSRLGTGIAISGDSIVATEDVNDCPSSTTAAAYVFQRPRTGWANETQTSVLTPSDNDRNFGARVAMDGDTVVIGSAGKAYVFERPAAGWKSMHEVAQLTIPNAVNGAFGYPVAIVGDTIVVGGWSSYAVQSAFIFVKPAGGWVSTSTYIAQLTPPAPNGAQPGPLAFTGDALAMSFYGVGVYVFQEPQSGWATTEQPAALLTRANGTYLDSFGASVAIGGDTIAVGANTVRNADSTSGVVDLFVKPANGWKNMTETAEVYPPYAKNPGENAGYSVAIDSEHLVVSTDSNQFYVYSKPATGWKSGAWPSQVFVGSSGNGPATGLGNPVTLQGATIATAASGAIINGVAAGALYVFPLPPSSIEISSDFLKFSNISLGSSEVLPVTITNPSASTLNLTTWLSSGHYQILSTAENTCTSGIPAGQSCTLPIQFDPHAVGQHNGYLNLSSPSTASFRVIELQGLAEGADAN